MLFRVPPWALAVRATRSGAHDEAELMMGGGGQQQQWLWLWHGGPVGRSQGVVVAPQGEREKLCHFV